MEGCPDSWCSLTATNADRCAKASEPGLTATTTYIPPLLALERLPAPCPPWGCVCRLLLWLVLDTGPVLEHPPQVAQCS